MSQLSSNLEDGNESASGGTQGCGGSISFFDRLREIETANSDGGLAVECLAVAPTPEGVAGEAITRLQAAMNYRLDDVRRHLDEGTQHMARQNAELERLQKVLSDLCAAVERLDTQVTAKRQAAVAFFDAAEINLPATASNEIPAPILPDPRGVELKLCAIMGQPAITRQPAEASGEPSQLAACLIEQRLSALMCMSAKAETSTESPVGTAMDADHSDHFDSGVTETRKGSLAQVATLTRSNRRRRRFWRSPVLHIAIGGLIAASAGVAVHWVPQLQRGDHRAGLPLPLVWLAALMPVAKPEAKVPDVVPLPAEVPKVPVSLVPPPSPPPPHKRIDTKAQTPAPKPLEDVQTSAPIVASGDLAGNGTKPAPAAKNKKGKKDRKKAAPQPVQVVTIKPEPAKKAAPGATVASSPAKQEPPPEVEPPKKATPQPRPKEPQPPVVAAELVRINGGTVVVGDGIDGMKDALPHRVALSPYLIGRHEVMLELWEKVRKWGADHGYDLPVGMGKAFNHPVYGVAWADAVKWCNARSEMEKLAPCYYKDPGLNAVFRSGEIGLSNRCVKWDANGFRLPTEAEWETASRGRLDGKRFPWGDQISHQHANYNSTSSTFYDTSSEKGPPPAFLGQLPHTAPVGSFKSNGFGLHDMAGNVAEWCWDFYDKHYGIAGLEAVTAAGNSLALPAVKDPRGPDSGTTSVVRGGSWRHDATDARCASRFDLPGASPSPHVGFRVVRRG